ncbi:hypothetical protein L1987_78469 [Smallanthus sonchifolius]|uniref:Uncharacterized protein n=1 Tax=Smallanthus sonchifolius TaxID=185202 RepID=A0ACB8ZCZ7_9ASTR|nr:hypothetical protein L1987_78469 [Smallanthus sonchifolius]
MNRDDTIFLVRTMYSKMVPIRTRRSMGSNTTSWSDQWGSGVFDNEEENYKQPNNKKKKEKMEQVKAAASTGLVKAKSAAIVGAHKVKKGTSTGFKWIKNKCSSSK